MFGLGGNSFPQDKQQLSAAIELGLRELLSLQGQGAVITVQGNWPALDLLRVDVSGAQAAVDRPPPDFRWVGDRRAAFSVHRLEVFARPLRAGSATLRVELVADDARFEYDRDKRARPLLVLAAARQGTAHAEMRRADLDALVRQAAGAAALQHGVSLSSIDLEIAQLGPRSIRAKAHVKAKKMFLSAGLVVGGRVDLDDAMNARLSELQCSGDGVLGEIVSVAVRGHLHRLEGTSFPLSSLGDLRLHDVRLSAADPMTLDAAFGD